MEINLKSDTKMSCKGEVSLGKRLSPAGKELTSWLSFVVSNCEFVSFPLVSWVRCGT